MEKKFLYSCYLLTSGGKDILVNWLISNKKEIKHNLYLHHCTIQFGQDTIIDNEMINKPVRLKIIGYIGNELANAFIVDKDSCISTNVNPHITISTDKDTKPVYSNNLFKPDSNAEIIYFDEPFIINTEIQKIYAN
jgi:hypothetical protein